MRPRHLGSIVVPLSAMLSGMTSVAASAQRVFVSSEPAVCVTPFTPISGLTFHVGGAFRIIWSTNFPQYGPVTYFGSPNPAYSDDGTKKWTNPTANVTCFLDWYRLEPTWHFDTTYRWHIDEYGGVVTSCDSGGGNVGGTGFTNVGMDSSYDPYGSSDPGGGPCGEPGTAGSTGGDAGGFNCHTEYIYIEISYDGGITWEGWWEGYATICDS